MKKGASVMGVPLVFCGAKIGQKCVKACIGLYIYYRKQQEQYSDVPVCTMSKQNLPLSEEG